MIQALTFDFWNTLVCAAQADTSSARLHAWIEYLAAGGHDVTEVRLREAYTTAWSHFDDQWRAGTNASGASGVDAARHLLSVLDAGLSPSVEDDLVELFLSAVGNAIFVPSEGLGDCLAALRAANVSIGIICDVGWTPSTQLRAALESLDLLGHFDHWSFSDETGWFKPDARMFEHARAGLGSPDPSTMAHIGDLRRTDVAGARAAGWTSIRYTGWFDDTADEHADADHVVASYADLPAALGL